MLMMLFTFVAVLSAHAAVVGWQLGDWKGSALLSANSAANLATAALT